MTSKYSLYLGLISLILLSSGCANWHSSYDAPPPPISKAKILENPTHRQTASTLTKTAGASSEIESWYSKYIEKQSPFARLYILETSVIKPLYDSLPEKAHPRKKLLGQFLQEFRAQFALVSNEPSIQVYTQGWLPARGNDITNIIKSLDHIILAYDVMNLMGIYLTSAGVFEKETQKENIYYSIIERALKEMNDEMKQRMSFNKPELIDAIKNNLKLKYTRDLVTDIRINLPKTMPTKNEVYRKLDRFFKELGSVNSNEKAKKLLTSSDFRYAEKALRNLPLVNSGEIDGYDDEINLEVTTKYYLGMTRVLLSGLR